MNTFQIIGFDRVSFVSDVTRAVPLNDRCRITGLSFEADGIRATGWLRVDAADDAHLTTLRRQLQAVRGVVQIKETN